ncbi:MAG: ribonuclease E/G [Eubacterium sp.]|nr:ribonuclease E/G [Eubacterium sp.]
MKRIVIDCREDLINTALTEDGELIEVISSEKGKKLNTGDIYTGKIKRILKSGFAFIDLGEDKNAFLFLKDKKERSLWEGKKLKIKECRDLIVQVVREAENEKGAMVTTALSAGESCCIVSVGSGEVRISRKITDEDRRRALKELFSEEIFSGFDIIVRTKAETLPLEEVLSEAAAAVEKIKKIKEVGEYRKVPACLYEGDGEALRAVKAFAEEGSLQIVTNNCEDYYKYIDPNRIFKADLYEGEIPIFKEYFIESKIKKALSPKVWLKSGGWLIIENTEAMVVIDVNSGKNNTKSHEETVFKTNKEAAEEILKQLRLRNLSGMIVIDFINMKSPENNRAVVKILEEEAKKDRISVTVTGMTELGLVLMTRKKTGLPLKSHLTKPCPHCGGKGYISKLEN